MKSVLYTSILYDWNLFKETWENKIVNNVEFKEFDKFILNELIKFERNKEYSNKIEKILIFNMPIGRISFNNNKLHVHESPFNIIINSNNNNNNNNKSSSSTNNNDKQNIYPCGFLLEHIITSLIKFINKNASSTIQIQRYRNKSHLEKINEI